MWGNILCDDCNVGYHPPFERFERIGVIERGPVFLQRCNECGTLWEEDLRSARKVDAACARKHFPDAVN